MTPEQHEAMLAVLKAVSQAVSAGLTEAEIADKIVKTRPSEPPESKSVASFDS
jgi:hypothetical protein